MNTKNKGEVFKCSICGNIVEVLHVGGSELVCCGKAMDLLEENTQDAATEKHVPVVEKTEKGIKVIVGETLHPMEEAHYIEWIEVFSGGMTFRKFLNPGDKPEAEFFLVYNDDIIAREYCNIHGLWKNS